jgi:feruloyl esterase
VRSPGALLALLMACALIGSSRADSVVSQDRDATACARLEGRRIAGGRIHTATFIRAPYSASWMGSTTPAVTRQSFCRLEGDASPSRRSHVGFEIWLPERATWNGRFLGVGAGGPLGDINRIGLADGVNRGFATVATDNGHRSPNPRDDIQWALGNPDRVVDFGHRAQHAATQIGQAATRAYYGRPHSHAYYAGCSQGGQKGLSIAQLYPGDYDGILAGAPVYSWAREIAQQAWTVRALTRTPQSAITPAQMQALQQAAMRACAGPSGLIEDPSTCSFDPSALACPRGGQACLSPDQIEAVRLIYQGPRTSEGRQIFPGFARGSERGWEQLYARVEPDGSVGGGSWLGMFRYMVFDDPQWTLPQLDLDRDYDLAEQRMAALNAEDADLDAFAARGGRMIVYHGWADQQVPPQASLDYLDTVRARRADADDFFRLFMVPGMPHCEPERLSAGVAIGPNFTPAREYDPEIPLTAENDALIALQAWVEEGRAPQSFTVRVRNESAGIPETRVRVRAIGSVPRHGD